MKLWKLSTFLTVSLLIFSGCVGNGPNPKAVIDSTLPIVTLTKHGVFTDMKAVGFEWNSVMSDPRVEGIYVYKKEVDSKEKANKFYETIDNRFVTHYVDSDVKPETAYSYVFKTFTKDSESVPSLEIVAKTLPVLKSVSWLHVVQEMPRSAKIIWRPHTNRIVENYIIERKTLADDKYKELALVKGRLNAEYIDLDLEDSHVYKYRIRAVTYNGVISTPSTELKVLTKALPKSVENIVASTKIAKKIKLTWKPTTIEDFSNYNIYRARSIDGSYDLITQIKDTSFMDNIAEDGKDYFYRVSVIDKDGLESNYDGISAHGKTLIKPVAPSMVGVKMIGDNLEISWKSTDPRVRTFVVEKTIKRSWIDSTTEEFIDIRGNTFVDTKIEPNMTYYYKVYSVDQFSIRSEPSMEVQYVTTVNQGKVINKETPKVKVTEEEKNIVTPMDDLSISEI